MKSTHILRARKNRTPRALLIAAAGLIAALCTTPRLYAPHNITIDNGMDTTVTGSPYFTPYADDSYLSWATIITALGFSDVTVTTGMSGILQAGNITIADAVTYNSVNNLTLDAAGSIFINADITNNGLGVLDFTSGASNIALTGNRTFTSGEVQFYGNVTGDGGSLAINSKARFEGSVSGIGSLAVSGITEFGNSSPDITVTTTGAQTYTGGIDIGSNATLVSTGNGAITIGGTTSGISTSTLSITTGGAVALNGSVTVAGLSVTAASIAISNTVTTTEAVSLTAGTGTVSLTSGAVLDTSHQPLTITGGLVVAAGAEIRAEMTVDAQTRDVTLGGTITAVSGGITFSNANTITNSGTLSSRSVTAGAGLLATTASTITNNAGGIIEGGWNGIELENGGTIINSGTIATTGTSPDGAAIYAQTAAASLTNKSILKKLLYARHKRYDGICRQKIVIHCRSKMTQKALRSF